MAFHSKRKITMQEGMSSSTSKSLSKNNANTHLKRGEKDADLQRETSCRFYQVEKKIGKPIPFSLLLQLPEDPSQLVR